MPRLIGVSLMAAVVLLAVEAGSDGSFWDASFVELASLALIVAGAVCTLCAFAWRYRFRVWPIGFAFGPEGVMWPEPQPGYSEGELDVRGPFTKALNINVKHGVAETLLVRLAPNGRRDGLGFYAHLIEKDWAWKGRGRSRIRRTWFGLRGWFEAPSDVVQFKNLRGRAEAISRRDWRVHVYRRQDYMTDWKPTGSLEDPRDWDVLPHAYFGVILTATANWKGFLILRTDYRHDAGSIRFIGGPLGVTIVSAPEVDTEGCPS